MIALILCLAPLVGLYSPDEAAWLSRLKLPKANDGVDLKLSFNDSDLEIAKFELGFPVDPDEMVEDAKERIEAGEPPARLLHQAALGMMKLDDKEKGWKVLITSLRAYEKEVEDAPDEFELRMFFASALRLGSRMSTNPIFIEKMREQYIAAAELEPGNALPGVESARALGYVWMAANSRGEVDAEWLDEGLVCAEEAIDAEPDAAGGYWWRFMLKMWLVGSSGSELSEEARFQLSGDALEELLTGCEEVDDGGRLQFAAHSFSMAFALREVSIEKGSWGPMGEHVDVLLAGMHLFADSEHITSRAGFLCWLYYCMTSEDDDWSVAFERTVDLGNTREIAAAYGALAFQKREQLDGAAELAAILEEELESDEGRAALARYRYLSEDMAGALEVVLEYDEVTPDREVQRGILLLRTEDGEAALELLEELAEEHDDDEFLYHALGVARALAGDLESAIEALGLAIDLMDESEEAEETLAELEELLGEE